MEDKQNDYYTALLLYIPNQTNLIQNNQTFIPQAKWNRIKYSTQGNLQKEKMIGKIVDDITLREYEVKI